MVRVIDTPDLSEMSQVCRYESHQVFEYFIGKYKTIQEFDNYGNVELVVQIRKGKNKGLHIVMIEPFLLKKKLRKYRK